jgi:prevent-host-death family protein
MKRMINTKELRASLSQIIERVKHGDQYTVLYRSRPVFCIVGVDKQEEIMCPLSDDPLFQAGAVGASTDGLSGVDHDNILYGTKM